MNTESQPNIRSLTQKHDSKNRKETAIEIRSVRSEHFKEINLVKETIMELEPKISELVRKISQIESEILETDKKIGGIKSSIIKKIFNNSEIKNLNQKKENAKIILECAILEKKFFDDEINKLSDKLDDKDKLDKTKLILDNFYEKQLSKIPIYEKRGNDKIKEKIKLDKLKGEDIIASKLENVIEENDVSFIHGLRLPGVNVEVNSMIKNDTPWELKLKTLLAIEPTISTSTIKPTDSVRHFWTPFGVFLNGGEILAAENKDMASKVRGLETRELWGKVPALGEMKNTIKKAIQTNDTYNEVITKDPAVCGFYIFDTDDYNLNLKIPPHEEIRTLSEELKLPVYIISSGKYWQATFDNKTHKYIKKDEVINPSLSPKSISENIKIKIKDEIFNNFPMAIEGWKNFGDIQSLAEGRKLYLELGAKNILPKIKGEGTILKSRKVEIITSFRSSGKKLLLVRDENRYLLNSLDSTTKTIDRSYEIRTDFEDLKEDDFANNFISLGHYTYLLNQKFYDIPSYIDSVDKTILDIQDRIKNKSYKEGENKDFLEKVLRKITYHAYGVYEQSKEFKDEKISEAIFLVASNVFPYSNCQKTFNERLGPNGEMRVTDEDLKEMT